MSILFKDFFQFYNFLKEIVAENSKQDVIEKQNKMLFLLTLNAVIKYFMIFWL